MKCWLCEKEGADDTSSIPDMPGQPYHKACVKCPKCGEEGWAAWKVRRDILELWRCQNCRWIMRREGTEWIPVQDDSEVWKKETGEAVRSCGSYCAAYGHDMDWGSRKCRRCGL